MQGRGEGEGGAGRAAGQSRVSAGRLLVSILNVVGDGLEFNVI